jgi:hypothetical protein
MSLIALEGSSCQMGRGHWRDKKDQAFVSPFIRISHWPSLFSIKGQCLGNNTNAPTVIYFKPGPKKMEERRRHLELEVIDRSRTAFKWISVLFLSDYWRRPAEQLKFLWFVRING